MRQLLHLLLLAATSALQAVAPRKAAPLLAPPTADLVLIDGDNVRGKTAFAVSAQSLLAQTRTFAATQDAVLYIDHGLAAECLAVEDNLRVVFAGTAQSADDCIVRDVAYLLEENPTLSVSVVTSDSGLIARCRKAARARGRNGRLDICGSVRFAETVLDEALGAEAFEQVQVNEDHVAVAKALQVSTERASLKRVRNKRLTKKRRRGSVNDVTASLASLNGLNDKPIKTPDAALEELVSNGATLPELEAAIRASGGGLRGREKTWERCVRAAYLHKCLRGKTAAPHKVLDGLAAYVNKLMTSRALAREAVLKTAKRPPRLKVKKRLEPLQRLKITESVSSKAWPGGWPVDMTVVETPAGAFLPDLVNCSVALVSDTHGFRIEDLPMKGDVLIHAGDFWLETQNRNRNAKAFEDFDAWLYRQDFAHKIVLRGNHDPVRCEFKASNATYIASKRQSIDLNGLKVYCVPHGSAVSLTKDFKALKELRDADILLTHAPPRGTLDCTYEGNNAGSKALRDAYYNACDDEAPTLWVCGHIHESAGAARVGATTIINAGMANAGRAKRLDRGFVAVGADLAEAPRAPPPPVIEEVEDELTMVGPALPRLLAVDLGEKTVGVALYDEHGALLDFAAASDEEDGAQAVVAAAARCLRGRPATVVVCEGTGRMLADEAFDALSESGLVACAAPHVINPDEWRAAVLADRERVNAKQAKHAARLVARQLAGGLDQWREDLTTDSAEACVFGAWASTELGWRDDAIVERFSNGDLRVVAKRPIVN
jgi:predicted phosphodiesterase